MKKILTTLTLFILAFTASTNAAMSLEKCSQTLPSTHSSLSSEISQMIYHLGFISGSIAYLNETKNINIPYGTFGYTHRNGLKIDYIDAKLRHKIADCSALTTNNPTLPISINFQQFRDLFDTGTDNGRRIMSFIIESNQPIYYDKSKTKGLILTHIEDSEAVIRNFFSTHPDLQTFFDIQDSDLGL